MKKPLQRGEAGMFGNRGTMLTGEWLALAKAYGGVAALAEVVGVSYSTLHRWALKGARIPAPARRVLAHLAEQKGLPPLPTQTTRG